MTFCLYLVPRKQLKITKRCHEGPKKHHVIIVVVSSSIYPNRMVLFLNILQTALENIKTCRTFHHLMIFHLSFTHTLLVSFRAFTKYTKSAI